MLLGPPAPQVAVVREEHARASGCVRTTPTGLPDWMKGLVRGEGLERPRMIAWKAGQLRACPHTTAVNDEFRRTFGDLGSRLFSSIRIAASAAQERHVSWLPRGAEGTFFGDGHVFGRARTPFTLGGDGSPPTVDRWTCTTVADLLAGTNASAVCIVVKQPVRLGEWDVPAISAKAARRPGRT